MKPYKGSYKNRRKHGLWETFHKNELTEYNETFKDGKRDGLYEMYHENSQLKKRRN